MAMATEIKRDPDLEWLDHVQPVGLVVAPVLLKDLGLAPTRQTQVDSAQVAEHIEEDESKPALRDPWSFVHDVLGWEARMSPAVLAGRRFRTMFMCACRNMGRRSVPPGRSRSLGNPIGPGSCSCASSLQASIRMRAAPSTAGKRPRISVSSGCFEKPAPMPAYSSPKGTAADLCAARRDVGTSELSAARARTVAGRPMLGGLKLLLDSFRLFADAMRRRRGENPRSR